jgi:hypothetical protein
MKYCMLIALILLPLDSFAASARIEKALVELTSTNMQVRRDAMDVIAYSDDPRIAYACLPLLHKNEGSTTRSLAARAIGSRFESVKPEDVRRFVDALNECLKEGESSRNRFDLLTRNCQRAIGLLTQNYDYPEVFSRSPDGRWIVYERRSYPVLIDTTTSKHQILPNPAGDFWHIITPDRCHWTEDSSIVAIELSRDRHTTQLCFWRVTDGDTWVLDPDEVHQRFKLWELIPNSSFSRSTTLEFVRWEKDRTIIKVITDRLDSNESTEKSLTFTPSTKDLRFTSLPEQAIEIQRWCDDLDEDKSLKTLKERTVEIFTGTDRGGTLKYYFNDQSVKKIILEIGLSRKDVIYSFYFKDSNPALIRTYEPSYTIDETTFEPDFTTVKDSRLRFHYFDKGKLLIVLDSDLNPIPIEDKEVQWLNRMSEVLVKGFQSNEKNLDLSGLIMH